MTTPWHDDDAFWTAFASAMFTPEMWEHAVIEMDQVLALAPIDAGAAVLDMCSGPGRHTLELAKRGFAVTGVDRTAAFVDMARAKAREAGVEVELVQGDMRTFARPDTYDLAINLYTSFSYFEDQADDLRVLENIHRSLVPGGALVMELMGKEVLARIFLERDWEELGDGTLMLEERRITDDWGWIENRWILVDEASRREFEFGHRLYAGTELRALAREAGFVDIELFGGLRGGPYDHEAHRLVMVARRGA